MVSVLEKNTLHQRDQARKNLDEYGKTVMERERDEGMIKSETGRGGAYRESDIQKKQGRALERK